MAEEADHSWITDGGDASPTPWEGVGGGGSFPSTRWSLVVRAAQDNTIASAALEELCRDYWYPLYYYARRMGKSAHDAQDLTQGFFEYLLAGDFLAKADHGKGKLRSYLLGALKHFSAYQYRKESAQKRGGGLTKISIDEEFAEGRFKLEPPADPAESPDRLFERRWALTVLDTVLKKLGESYEAEGKGELFATLARFLAWNSAEMAYGDAAAKLGMKEGAVRVAVHRMRKRYRECLHEEILATVSTPGEVEEEIDYLLKVLRG